MSASETVLVVDPDSKVLHDISLMLEPHGYTVITAKHGMEAIRVFEGCKTPVSLLITAVMMPGLSGFDVAGSLTQWNRRLGVIFMSEHDRQMLFDETAGRAKHFLHKPLSEQTLLQRVKDALVDRRHPAIAASQPATSALTA